MSGYIADTSVFIAAEQRRPLTQPPEGQARISVVTLTELGLGTRRADSPALRELRQATLARARRFVALPFDAEAADQLVGILAAAREQRRRAGAMDALIAATALANDLTVWSQDSDFDVLVELAPSLQVHRG